MCRNHTICFRTAHVAWAGVVFSLDGSDKNFCEHLLCTGTGLRDGGVVGIQL